MQIQRCVCSFRLAVNINPWDMYYAGCAEPCAMLFQLPRAVDHLPRFSLYSKRAVLVTAHKAICTLRTARLTTVFYEQVYRRRH